MTEQQLQEIEASSFVSLSAQALELLADDIESNQWPCDHQIKLVDELRTAIKKHRQDIPALIAALREAWADRERLDWLEQATTRGGFEIGVNDNGDTELQWWAGIFTGGDLRDAIDSARTANQV